MRDAAETRDPYARKAEPEISQEAARALLAALQDVREYLEGRRHAYSPDSPHNRLLRSVRTAIAVAEGR